MMRAIGSSPRTGRIARLALAAALALAVAGGISSQEAAAGASGPAPKALEPATRIDDEDPLARMGIVTLGSFPILLLYTDFSFDLGKYLVNGFDSTYAPWPFKSEYADPLSAGEKATRIGVAIGASVAVGLADFLIRSSKARKARLQREALLELSAERNTAIEDAPAPAPLPESHP